MELKDWLTYVIPPSLGVFGWLARQKVQSLEKDIKAVADDVQAVAAENKDLRSELAKKADKEAIHEIRLSVETAIGDLRTSINTRFEDLFRFLTPKP